MINPYQPTVIVENGDDDDAPRGLRIDERFDASERLQLRRGLLIIRASCDAAVFGITILGCVAIAQGTTDELRQTIGAGIICNLIGASIAGIWIGLMMWTGLPGPQRVFCYLAAFTLGLGLFATFTFVTRVLSVRVVGGLFPLFGASSFAMMLVSLAMIALISRGFAVSARSIVAVRTSELAVISYAVCAAICSSHALQYGWQSNAGLLIAMFVAGPAAMLLHGYSQHVLLDRLRQINDETSPDGAS